MKIKQFLAHIYAYCQESGRWLSVSASNSQLLPSLDELLIFLKFYHIGGCNSRPVCQGFFNSHFFLFVFEIKKGVGEWGDTEGIPDKCCALV